MPAGHGVDLLHQHAALELALDGGITAAGYTELTLVPTAPGLRSVHLHLRHARVLAVRVNGTPAAYAHNDLTAPASEGDSDGPGALVPPPAPDVHGYPALKRRLFAAASDGSQGELSIRLPDDVDVSFGLDGEAQTLQVRIDYIVEGPSQALRLVRPTPDNPHRLPHLYTSSSCPDWARCWIPCLDSLWDRCTWHLDFVVPRHLSLPGAAPNDVADVAVVCSGTLIETVAHPHDPSKVLWSFEHAAPTTVQHIAFAVGPFQSHSFAPTARVGQAPAEGELPAVAAVTAPAKEPQVMGFALPGQEDMMVHSIGFTRTALDFFARDYGSYPFDSFAVVFVEEPMVDCHIGSTLAICSSDLLHPPTIIDQAYETHQIVAHAIAWQWIGINLIQRSWADTWLIHGVSLHMAGMFLRRVWGNNEYRFRLRKDVNRLINMDVAMPPLFQPGLTEPPDRNFISFINLKAPLVLHILDRKLAKVGSSFGLNRALNRIFMEALTGSLDNNVLSTSHFLRLCRKLQGVDLSAFTEQWVHGSGCPRFTVSANFNRKKFIIEMRIQQECAAYRFAQTNPTDAIYSNPVQTFEGQMTVRIHEADGTPYEHVIEIDALDKRVDVPFNTKYKRVRRNTKRFQARKEAAAAAAAGDEEAREAMGLMDLGFIYGQWEDESTREEWRVADWTEQEEVDMNNAPYEWIRLDAEFEWLADFSFQQEPWMWASQLERDRDIVAQLEAVKALSGMPSTVVSSLLTRTVLVDRYFFRVRTEAAQALVNCAIESLDFIGLFHLYKLFQFRYCYPQPAEYQPKHALDLLLVPRANDFSDLADYFLRRTIIHAIARVRDQQGRPFDHVRRFLVNALRYNDNSTNKLSDDYYVAGLINSIALAFLPAEHNLIAAPPPPSEEDEQLLQAAVTEVESCRELDMLVPSYHNVVSVASLDFHLASMLASLRPVDLQLFFVYTRPGNFVPLRLAAFNCLLLLGGIQHKIVARYVFSILRTDDSQVVRRTLAQLVVESLAVAIATNVHGELKPRRPIYVESELDVLGATQEADRARQADLGQVLRVVRREVGRSAAIRQGFLGALLDPQADEYGRWALIKLGELLFKPAAETELPAMPKVPVTAPRLTLRINSDVDPSSRGVAFDPKRRERSLPKLTLRGGKAKKQKPVPREQLSGMGPLDVTACRNSLRTLYSSQHAWLFKNPVDPVRDSAPNYLAVISEPMDLSTIENKLNSGLYPDRGGFKKDFDLMIANAKAYTPDPRAFVHMEADKLGRDFERHWSRISRTIEAAEAKHKAQAAKAAQGEDEEDEENEPLQQSTRPAPPGPAQSDEDEEDEDAPLALTAAPPPPPKPKPVKLKFKPRASAPAAPAPAAAASSSPAAASGPGSAVPVPIATLPKVRMKLSKPRSSTPAAASASATSAPAPPPPMRASSPLARASSPAALPSTRVSLKVPKVSAKVPAKAPANAAAQAPANASATAPAKVSAKAPKAHPNLAAKVPARPPPVAPPLPAAPRTALPPTASTPASSPAATSAAASAPVAGASHAKPKNSKPSSAEPQPELALSDPVGAAGKAPFHPKRARAVIQALKKLPEAIFFLRPVDPILDGAPTYLEEIAHPMDLGTMEKKIASGAYGRMSEFASDALLIFANARQFNPPTTVPYIYADAVEAAFLQEWSKALVPSLEYAEKRALQGLLSRLKHNVMVSGLFLQAVDPVALGIPHYFTVIPKEDARDLSLIETKLKSDQYVSVKGFTDDVALMVGNARKFNALDPAVLALVDAFEKQYRKELGTARQSINHALGINDTPGAKRKSGAGAGASAQGASKKARH